jgi:hypothetical protein
MELRARSVAGSKTGPAAKITSKFGKTGVFETEPCNLAGPDFETGATDTAGKLLYNSIQSAILQDLIGQFSQLN